MFQKIKTHLIVSALVILFTEVVFISLTQVLFVTLAPSLGLGVINLVFIIYPSTLILTWIFARNITRKNGYLKPKQLASILTIIVLPILLLTGIGIRNFNSIFPEFIQQLKIIPIVFVSSVLALIVFSRKDRSSYSSRKHWFLITGIVIFNFGGIAIATNIDRNLTKLNEAKALPFKTFLPTFLPSGFEFDYLTNSIAWDEPEEADIRLTYLKRTLDPSDGGEVTHSINIVQISATQSGIITCTNGESTMCWDLFGYLNETPIYSRSFQSNMREAFIQLDGTSITVNVNNSNNQHDVEGRVDDSELLKIMQSLKPASAKELVEYSKEK